MPINKLGNRSVGFSVPCDGATIIGHFREGYFQAVDCTAIDKQTQ